MQLLSSPGFGDYELIDSGGFEKLERFGSHILSRPEPQALWDKSLSDQEWKRIAHARFIKEKNNPDKGKWEIKPETAEQWRIRYNYKSLELIFRLGFTAFRHVGIFPEQAVNWNYLFDHFSVCKHQPSLLNLFAYTGGASLAACAAGARVVHLDSVKQVVFWARQNAEASGLSGIRWIVEDALKFVVREGNRGNVYDAIMLDPPPYGRGPKGEKWILEEKINDMLKNCRKILKPSGGHLILNLYSVGFSPLLACSLAETIFQTRASIEYGELYETDKAGRRLSRGIFLRLIT